jgi:hypothetical protein
VDRLGGWSWDLGGNDRFGTCGPAFLANHLDLTTAILTGREVNPSDADVFDLYRRSGNPTFDPNKPPGSPGDDGVFPSLLFKAAAGGGLAGHRLIGWAALADTSDASIQAAVNEFGGVGVSLELQRADLDSSVWVYNPSSPVVGGHLVTAGGYDRATGTLSCVSWRERKELTRPYLDHRLTAAYVPIWPELLQGRFFAAGLDTDRLATDFRGLTGQVFPEVSHQLALDLDRRWLVGRPAGWLTSGLSLPFPAYVGMPTGDVMVMFRPRMVCVPEPYRFQTAGNRVVIDLGNKAVYAPPGWTLSVGTGSYTVGGPGRESDAVVLHGRVVMLPAGYWSAV